MLKAKVYYRFFLKSSSWDGDGSKLGRDLRHRLLTKVTLKGKGSMFLAIVVAYSGTAGQPERWLLKPRLPALPWTQEDWTDSSGETCCWDCSTENTDPRLSVENNFAGSTKIEPQKIYSSFLDTPNPNLNGYPRFTWHVSRSKCSKPPYTPVLGWESDL